MIERQKAHPFETARSMFTERLSLAMNQRGQIYKKEAAVEQFNARLNEVLWAVYRVRRIYKAKPIYAGAGKQKRFIGHNPNKKGNADRCVERLEIRATHDEALTVLRALAVEHSAELPTERHGLWYAYIKRCESTYPTTEEFLVAAPANIETKARYGVEHFDSKWDGMTGLYCGHADLPLFASLDFDNDSELPHSE